MRRASRIRDYALERAKWRGPNGSLHGSYADYYASLFFRWCAIYAAPISIAPEGEYAATYTTSKLPEIKLLQLTRNPLWEVAKRISERIPHHGTEQSFWNKISGSFKSDWATFIVNGERVIVHDSKKIKRIAELHFLYAITGSDGIAKRIVNDLSKL